MLIKIKEAADQLAICPKQVRKLIDSGRLQVVPCGTSSRGDRIDEADIQEFINENKQRKKKCQSISAEIAITSLSRSTVNGLEELLDKELRGNKPRNSKQNSVPILRRVK